ncbi:MAG TPA: hypothetical protein VFG30_30740 [Polyangiales bacterium]|nr:hypothetical protein [Polyangiales bacterium]
MRAGICCGESSGVAANPRARARGRARALPVSLGLLPLLLVAACGDNSRPPVQRSLSPAATSQPEAAEDERAPSWATEVGKSLSQGWKLGAANRVTPATVSDRQFDSLDPVTVRRLVYRATIDLPQGLRAPHSRDVLPSPSELHLDVAVDRLRGRFVGPSWPVDDGSELRMRADVPGVYLFDGAGGRPLAPGHLASWFNGDEGEQFPRQPVVLRPDPGPSAEGPSELVCALIAEWTAQPRQALENSCENGTIIQKFKFGVWSFDLTAIVPMTMPRAQLRADSVGLPKPLSNFRLRHLLETRDIERLAPIVIRPAANNNNSNQAAALAPIDAGPPGSGVLRAENRGSTRMLLVVQGVPLAWLQPRAATEFSGFTPGYYRVGAVRAYAQNALTPNPMVIPGQFLVGLAPAEPAPPEATRAGDAPDAAPTR